MKYEDFPRDLMQEHPLEVVLSMLGFVGANLGVVRKYGDLEFGVCESIDCSFLSRDGRVTRNTWTPPYEVRIFSPTIPIELLATIYRLWVEVYPDRDPPDSDLYWGKEWLNYQREVKRLIPPPPTLWVDREFLRYCLTYVERQHDWVDEDYEVRFSQAPGQLRINAKEAEVYCPAHGNWIGEAIVQAKVLFRRLPKRFVGNVVLLEAQATNLNIDRHVIPARWVDSDDVLPGESAETSGTE